MYFVVRLEILKKNVVLPSAWINEIDKHFEKFVNKSLNCSQKFVCYYTTNETAFDNGRPKCEIMPDLSADLVTEINPDGSYDGCFLGKLQHFSSESHYALFLILLNLS